MTTHDTDQESAANATCKDDGLREAFMNVLVERHGEGTAEVYWQTLLPYADDILAALRRVSSVGGGEEQLRVQLAGCLVAAEGGTSPAQVAKEGDYGWSASYQAVLDLRQKYDLLIERYEGGKA